MSTIFREVHLDQYDQDGRDLTDQARHDLDAIVASTSTRPSCTMCSQLGSSAANLHHELTRLT